LKNEVEVKLKLTREENALIEVFRRSLKLSRSTFLREAVTYYIYTKWMTAEAKELEKWSKELINKCANEYIKAMRNALEDMQKNNVDRKSQDEFLSQAAELYQKTYESNMSPTSGRICRVAN
jgi:hypothetical protein